MQGKLVYDLDRIRLRFKPVLDAEREYFLARKSDVEWPIHFRTNTTNMKDFIANVTSVNNGVCSVRGVYRGAMRDLKGIRVCSPAIKKVGDRVMVTEHISVSGKFGYIATKERVLKNDCHFVNIGWSSDKGSRYLVIDIYTGEVRKMNSKPIPPCFVR